MQQIVQIMIQSHPLEGIKPKHARLSGEEDLVQDAIMLHNNMMEVYSLEYSMEKALDVAQIF